MSGLIRPAIFIAYSHANQKFVGKLASALRAANFQPLWDGDVLGGGFWPWVVRRWINTCDGSMMVLSRASIESINFNNELLRLVDRSVATGQPAVPILLEPVPIEDWPIKLVGFQAIDFSDPSRKARRAAFEQLFAALRSHRPTQATGRVRAGTRGLSLRMLFFLVVVALLLIPLVSFALRQPSAEREMQRLREIQNRVQALDVRVHELARERKALYSGSLAYEDIATDRWTDGRLTTRDFFQEGRLIARDTFVYEEGVIVGKNREHYDRGQRNVLTDRYAQGGVLVEKLDCPDGDPSRCIRRVDILPSPLPPPSHLIFLPAYR